jgi:peptide/nickel transport system substrate-binding protein
VFFCAGEICRRAKIPWAFIDFEILQFFVLEEKMKAIKVLFSVIVVLCLIAGCAPAVPPTPPTPTTAAATAASTSAGNPAPTATTAAPTPVPSPAPTTAPQKATLIFTQEFDTLNPLYTNMYFSTITHQFWNCWAWDFDDQNQPRPVLVKDLPSNDNGGVSADGKVITMKLRDDIVWSDGQPITADDFIFTWQMYVNPSNTVATTHPYDLIDKIEAPDAHTVVITFKDPFSPWLDSLWKGMLPKHILQADIEKDGNINNAPWNRAPSVGCGPYLFDKWESGSYAHFVANPKYWGAKPKIGELTVRFVPDDASQIAALKAGDGLLGTFISYSDIPDLQKAGLQVIGVKSGYNEGLYFYLDPKKGHPALQDVRVRQAIAYATNRLALTKDLLLGLTQPAATDWDGTPYVDPTIQPYPFDPEKAKQLLDGAGWKAGPDGVRQKDGVKLELKYGSTDREIRKDTQAVFQQQLKDVGIKVTLLNFDSETFFNGYDKQGPAATGQLDLYQFSEVSTAFPDPDIAEWLCSDIPSNEKPTGTNWSAVCDKDLDQLFQDQASQIDFKTRQQTFFKITRMIFDKAYWIGFWQDPDQWAVSDKLTNVKLSGVTPFYNIAEWDLKK